MAEAMCGAWPLGGTNAARRAVGVAVVRAAALFRHLPMRGDAHQHQAHVEIIYRAPKAWHEINCHSRGFRY